MFYTLLGFVSAALLGILSVALAKGSAAVEPAWLDPLFWALIAGGVLMDRRHGLRTWFLRQTPLLQNAVVAALFLAIGGGVTLLLGDHEWTWHIPG